VDLREGKKMADMMEAKEAAEYLRVSYWSVLNWARQRKIPHVRVGSRVLFSREGLDRWIADMEAQSVRKPEPIEYGKLRKIKG